MFTNTPATSPHFFRQLDKLTTIRTSIRLSFFLSGISCRFPIDELGGIGNTFVNKTLCHIHSGLKAQSKMYGID